MDKINLLANHFFHAFYHHQWENKSLLPYLPTLTVDEAYQVQSHVTRLRINNQEKVVGYKVGCTSTAIQRQFGINEPIFAPIFYPHVFRGDTISVPIKKYHHLAIEPEMVIHIKKDISGNGLTHSEVLAAIDYVSVGIELHHYHFWHTPPCLQELICSGGIHSGLIIGNQHIAPHTLNFKTEVFRVYANDQLELYAQASEIMGGALISLKWLIEKLTQQKHTLKKGAIVIPGSPTRLYPVNRETKIRVGIDNIGELEAAFVL